jgi:FKBP-type peptidyl-prolyl cis-trans isomerase 2
VAAAIFDRVCVLFAVCGPCSLGGLAKDLAVELANGSMAVVVEATPEYVKLDANNMMSGKKLMFELEVLGIERP